MHDEQKQPQEQVEQPVESVPPTPIPEPEPEQNKVQVQCGACKRNFELALPEPNVTGFEFDCTSCGAHNSVEL